jgi:exodeoxyribonuclease VII small subunit
MDSSFNYENAKKMLLDIVNKLEQGSISLDDSIKLFEQGSHLVKNCQDFLKKAKDKIEAINKKEDK